MGLPRGGCPGLLWATPLALASGWEIPETQRHFSRSGSESTPRKIWVNTRLQAWDREPDDLQVPEGREFFFSFRGAGPGLGSGWKGYTMKKLLLSALGPLLVAGCVGLHVGGGPKTVQEEKPTVGQQLIDLQKARDSGAITPQEYEAQKAKLMAN